MVFVHICTQYCIKVRDSENVLKVGVRLEDIYKNLVPFKVIHLEIMYIRKQFLNGKIL